MVRCAASKLALCQLAQPKLATRALLACFRTRRQTGESPRAIAVRLAFGRLACTEDRAYVLASYDASPDSVFVYHLNGEEERVMLPTEGIDGMMDCRRWVINPGDKCRVGLHRLHPSFDDRRGV